MSAQEAAVIAQDALRSVFDAEAVAALRADSPLAAVGLVPADLVALGDAVRQSAARRGRTCLLSEEDLVGAASVADLLRAIDARMEDR